MDWRVFYGQKLAEDLKMRSDAVKAIDPHHITTSHAPNPSPLFRTLADPYDPTDDFLMKDSVDYFGTSLYPKLTSPENNWNLNRRVLAMDLARAITGGRGFYVGELQSGFGIHGTIIGSEVTSRDLDLWTWGMVSRGARAINYYAFYPMNAGYESGGYGMINLDGTLTERSRRAGQTAQSIAANAARLLQSQPQPAEAAIVFSPLVPLLGGYDEEMNRYSIHQALAGYHRMFFERNLPLDVLSSRELAALPLERYKLIILPFALMMTTEQANALRQYVKQGGNLFVEARPGWVNESGFAEPMVPGFGWQEMLGVREQSLEPGKEFPVRWGTDEFIGLRLQEHLEPLDSGTRAVGFFSDGSPAAFEHHFGKGSTLILGSFAGQANEQKPVVQHPLGGILARWAGLTLPDFKAPGLVELRQMISTDGQFIFFFNHGGRPSTVVFKTLLEKPASKIQELITSQSLTATGLCLLIKTEIPAEAVRVYRVDF
jgi:beta-galactosidase